MKNKITWLALSLLALVSMVVVSCGQTTTPGTTGTAVTGTAIIPTATGTTAPTATTTVKTTATTTATTTTAQGKPKYGGTITAVISFPVGATGIDYFAPLVTNAASWGEGYILEQIITGDHSRSKAGTGEFDLGPSSGTVPSVPSWNFVVGWLAESFEMPANGIWVLNIRKGVHFALDPNSEASRLVNGREMTADDIKYSFEMLRDTPGTRPNLAQPDMIKNMTVEKTGLWQLTVKTPVNAGVGYQWLMGGGGVTYVWPKEWLDKYGKINDWKNMVGTGPYMLTDYVSGSSLTMKRNPNYWRKDDVGLGKGNQLPYPDGIQLLIVPDISSQLAAMRTGKGDMVEAIQREDAQNLLKSRPNLQSYAYLPLPYVIGMRTDKESLPFKNLKVRQALMMATDFNSIKNNLYNGQADTLTLPVNSTVSQVYIPIEKLPSNVQALYKYNPTGAKQLLAEAGYPNGFKTKVVIDTSTASADLVSVVKDMWAKSGINLEIEPREGSVYTATRNARSHDELILFQSNTLTPLSNRFDWSLYAGRNNNNQSYVNNPPGADPTIENAFQITSSSFMVNPQKADNAVRDTIPHILGQAYYIELASPYTYRIWQPWLKGYYGEGGLVTSEPWGAYPWIDQDLKGR